MTIWILTGLHERVLAVSGGVVKLDDLLDLA